MTLAEFKALRSGSDVRGIALADRQKITLTDEAVHAIAAAFAHGLWTELGGRVPRIAVGHDSRLSAQRIKAAVISGLGCYGVTVLDAGLCTTPAMYMTTVDELIGADGAIMITASHLPFDRNGLKFFTREGGLDYEQIEVLLTRAAKGGFPTQNAKVEQLNYLPRYAAMLRGVIAKETGISEHDEPLKGLKINVDAGNGAGGFFAPMVLNALGADTSGSQFLEPDGSFPNHIPNPEAPEAMEAASRMVLNAGASLGVVFDTDVDRAGLVDGEGNPIDRNRLIALTADMVLKNHPGGVIVTDSITSDGLAEFITQRGGVHRRFKRGYRNVINEMQRLSDQGVDCPLAMETSGHAAFYDNHCLDDGAFLAARLIGYLARSLREGGGIGHHLQGLTEALEQMEVRLPISAEDFRAAGQAMIDALDAHAKASGWQIAPDNYEGIRISFPQGEGAGWLLLRLSVHDPLLALNIEADEAGGARAIARRLLSALPDSPGIDTAPLAAAAQASLSIG